MAGGRRRKQGRRKSCVVSGEVDPLGGRWPSRQRKNPGQIRICVFVHITNRHSTWRDYLCKKAKQNKYTNRSGHFLAFICVSVQKKHLLALPDQTNSQKNSRKQKKLCTAFCIFVYLCIGRKKSQPKLLLNSASQHAFSQNVITPRISVQTE